jgi:hypothetical protein
MEICFGKYRKEKKKKPYLLLVAWRPVRAGLLPLSLADGQN